MQWFWRWQVSRAAARLARAVQQRAALGEAMNAGLVCGSVAGSHAADALDGAVCVAADALKRAARRASQ